MILQGECSAHFADSQVVLFLVVFIQRFTLLTNLLPLKCRGSDLSANLFLLKGTLKERHSALVLMLRIMRIHLSLYEKLHK